MISIAGVLSFFIMIFDSLRRARAHIRNTLGINRFNTRVSFYIFANANITLNARAFAFLARNRARSGLVNAWNGEVYETTLVSYKF